MRTLGLMLAAGHSRRFRHGDKLLCKISQKPMIHWVSDTLRALALDEYAAIVSNDFVANELTDFTIIRSEHETATQGQNLASGVRYAMEQQFDRVLIVLGDMPFVSANTLSNVLELSDSQNASAAYDGSTAMPPAALPKSMYEKLLTSNDDQGAKKIIQSLPKEFLFHATKNELIDIDAQEDLIRVQGLQTSL